MTGRDVKEVIEKSGLKQNFIAKQIGVSPVMLNYYLNEKGNLKESKLYRLYEILKIEG